MTSTPNPARVAGYPALPRQPSVSGLVTSLGLRAGGLSPLSARCCHGASPSDPLWNARKTRDDSIAPSAAKSSTRLPMFRRRDVLPNAPHSPVALDT